MYPDEIANGRTQSSKKDRDDFTVFPLPDKSFELFECNINSSQLYCCQEVVIGGIPSYEDEVCVCVRVFGDLRRIPGDFHLRLNSHICSI